MKNLITLVLLAYSLAAYSQSSSDAERLRISSERAVLDADFKREDAACYKKFLVNSCLDEIKVKRREAMADLRRQEISMNDQDRKAKAAEQVKKTEDKASPEKQQEAADKRGEALKEFDARMARDQQKNAGRVSAVANEKTNKDAAASRIKSAQDKQAARTTKQGAAAEELKKYNERVQKAQDRQAKAAKEKASQPKSSVKALPVPD